MHFTCAHGHSLLPHASFLLEKTTPVPPAQERLNPAWGWGAEAGSGDPKEGWGRGGLGGRSVIGLEQTQS